LEFWAQLKIENDIENFEIRLGPPSEWCEMIIKHRVNTIQELSAVPISYGVEIDLRIHNGIVVLAHDPFEEGEEFEEWLFHYHHKLLILNVKEDGLENTILGKLLKKGVTDFFFLDQPFPTLRKSALSNLPTSLRLSEYENPMSNLDFVVKWIWLDSFSGDWKYLEKHAEWIRSGEFSTCLVSPELQGRAIGDEPVKILRIMRDLGIQMTAVCTKEPKVWEGLQE
jgi:hypothetical protein